MNANASMKYYRALRRLNFLHETTRTLSTTSKNKTLESLAIQGSCPHPSNGSGGTALSLLGTSLDVRRFDTLVHAGPMDFQGGGLVYEVPNEKLDWNTTIFHTITDPQLTQRLKKRFGQIPLWSDSVIATAARQAMTLPPQQYFCNADILDFMRTHCKDFKNEHADGSFLDHLDFCAEYTARYFHDPRASPHVLFLHSICGVNTNLFPLKWSKIPELEPLLTEHEFLHIQAFPCMLRLLFIDLMDTLWDAHANGGKEAKGVSIHTFHGNTDLTLSGDEFWIQLNYHLIHLLDFLPTQHFEKFVAAGDAFTRLFLRLHEFLRNNNKLMADVRLERLGHVPGMSAEKEVLPTWEYLLSKVNNNLDDVDHAHAQLGAQLRQYSKAINHNLTYEVHWK